ncbi:uncharacterized protein UHO2_01488 [Ustilago hordei]|uniref:uncharacterized protein n=1 Tax=Ustilago hordei TaxID=120017 RepID=UPI001A441B0B|nr:uncharacterized protein UHO2_01488 [Ustilago hordei]SYW74622.1 uncharacterized protein UHO2_01488 [Ustilago hordei]
MAASQGQSQKASAQQPHFLEPVKPIDRRRILSTIELTAALSSTHCSAKTPTRRSSSRLGRDDGEFAEYMFTLLGITKELIHQILLLKGISTRHEYHAHNTLDLHKTTTDAQTAANEERTAPRHATPRLSCPHRFYGSSDDRQYTLAFDNVSLFGSTDPSERRIPLIF